jgi:hypothetical protein
MSHTFGPTEWTLQTHFHAAITGCQALTAASNAEVSDTRADDRLPLRASERPKQKRQRHGRSGDEAATSRDARERLVQVDRQLGGCHAAGDRLPRSR